MSTDDANQDKRISSDVYRLRLAGVGETVARKVPRRPEVPEKQAPSTSTVCTSASRRLSSSC